MQVALHPVEVETTTVMKYNRQIRTCETYLCIPEGVSGPWFIYEADKFFSIEFGKTLCIKYKVACKTAVLQ